MKKIMMTLVAVAMATTMNAQWYVGGSVGFGSVKHGDSESTYKFIPEVGYNLNDQWAVGVAFGYQKGDASFGNGNESINQDVLTETFTVSPYARYTVTSSDAVSVFVDGGIDYKSIKDNGSVFGIGLRPGIAVKASDKLSFVAHLGFVGYENYSPKHGDSSNAFGLDLSNNVSFGLYYNF